MATTETINLHETELPEVGNALEVLPVQLSADEWTERATMAAALGGEIIELEAELKRHTKQVRDELRDLGAERKRAELAVRNYAEPRPVGVRVLADLARGEAVCVRVDTGQIIERRALTDLEFGKASQAPLAFPSS
jgi:hypothetical protein